MTTLNEAREAVYQRFQTEWTATDFSFENETFNSETQPEADSWVFVWVRSLDSFQETMGPIGGRVFQRKSQVILDLRTPGTGPIKVGDEYAQSLRAVFEGIRLGDLVFQSGLPNEVGTDGKWYRHVITVPFSYWETK